VGEGARERARKGVRGRARENVIIVTNRMSSQRSTKRPAPTPGGGGDGGGGDALVKVDLVINQNFETTFAKDESRSMSMFAQKLISDVSGMIERIFRTHTFSLSLSLDVDVCAEAQFRRVGYDMYLERENARAQTRTKKKVANICSLVILYRKNTRALTSEIFMFHITYPIYISCYIFSIYTFHTTYYTYTSYCIHMHFIFYIPYTSHITYSIYISYILRIHFAQWHCESTPPVLLGKYDTKCMFNM
jgi:hypothetical protein